MAEKKATSGFLRGVKTTTVGESRSNEGNVRRRGNNSAPTELFMGFIHS